MRKHSLVHQERARCIDSHHLIPDSEWRRFRGASWRNACRMDQHIQASKLRDGPFHHRGHRCWVSHIHPGEAYGTGRFRDLTPGILRTVD